MMQIKSKTKEFYKKSDIKMLQKYSNLFEEISQIPISVIWIFQSQHFIK